MTDRGVMIKNRATWTVTAVNDDASLSVKGVDGAVVLAAAYVESHVELGYAQTTHAAQGRTVDVAILVADGHLDSRGLYVGLTRGRHANHAFVVTSGDGRTGNDILATAISRDWADEPAMRTQLDVDPTTELWGRQLPLSKRGRALAVCQLESRDLGDDFGAEL